MVRIHKRSKISYCQIRDGGVYVWRNKSGWNNWYILDAYVLQTELLNDGKNGAVVEYLEGQDADEYANESKYINEITKLKDEIITLEQKLKAEEEKSIELNNQIEWLTQNNLELGKLLEQERSKKTKKKEEE